MKEMGPREKALREMREAKYDNRFPKTDRAGVKAAVTKVMAGIKKRQKKKAKK